MMMTHAGSNSALREPSKNFQANMGEGCFVVVDQIDDDMSSSSSSMERSSHGWREGLIVR